MTAQQLKNSILQMAVQGKLVPQDPDDEPASVLLERIKKEKQELVKAGKIKKDSKSSEIFRGASRNLPYTYCEHIGKEIRDISDEIPFDIPDSWEWVRLGCISTYNEKKQKINAKDADSSIWGLDLEDIEKGGKLLEKKTVGERKAVGDKTVFSKGDILYSKLRPYLLKILIAHENGICTPEIVPFTVYGNISAEYIVNYLKSPYVDGMVNGETYGIKMPRAGTETMVSLLVPVPPLSEQHRIVSKIEELIPYIERYGDAETKLNELNTTFPEALKKSILQEAVRGKLVPQDPNDEPASVLLERIRAEKQKLIKAGKIKKDKNETVIVTRDKIPYEIIDGKERCIADEVPFELPESWCWCRLGSISKNIQYGTSKKSLKEGKVPVLRMGNLQNGKIIYDKLVYSSDDDEISRYPLLFNDLLFNRTNSREIVGKTAIYKAEMPAIYAGYLVRITPMINSDYLNYIMQSQYYWIYCQSVRSDAIGQSNINAEKLKHFLVPLPPLDEQRRIVAKIEELLPFIDEISS